MADLLSCNDVYAYLRVKVPRGVFERHLERFGGDRNMALRELRFRWEGVVASLDAGTASGLTSGPDPSRSRVW